MARKTADGTCAQKLREHLERGRSVWLLPSASWIESPTSEISATTLLGFTWKEWRSTSTPQRPETWRSDEGLLAATQSGTALPVGEINVTGYATFEGDATPLATLGDGSPLLAKLNLDRGHAYACATLPIDQSSNMAKNGIALFVAVQRSIEQASATLGKALMLEAASRESTHQASSSELNPVRHRVSNSDPTTNPLPLALAPASTWETIATDDRSFRTRSVCTAVFLKEAIDSLP